MLNNMQNFFATIASKLVKKKPSDTDLIAIGSKNDNYGAGYAPTAIKYADLKADILSNLPAEECGTKFGLNWATVGPKISFRKPEYQTGIRDVIIPGELEIARDDQYGIYNAALETEWDQNVSPLNTSWNSKFTTLDNGFGWANLGNAADRSYGFFYDALDQAIGCEIVGMELVFRDDNSGRMWIIKFTEWTQGGDGGGFAYDRYELYAETYFYRPPLSNAIVDVVSEGLVLKRDNNRGIYNAVLETRYDNKCDKSPLGTEWNSVYTDSVNYGNSNLANVRNRKFGTWREAVDANPPSMINVPMVMHDLSTDLYWLVFFTDWASEGNNGSFGLRRLLIPQDCGIEFNDGTVMTTAATGGGTTCCPVLDANTNLIIDDNSANTVSVAIGGSQQIADFSGMLLVNDHYSGRVETWIAGSGDATLLGYTDSGAGIPTSAVTQAGNGYEWKNNDGLQGPFTFTVIKTRNGA